MAKETEKETPAPETETPAASKTSAAEINSSVEMPAPSERTIAAMAQDVAPAAGNNAAPAGNQNAPKDKRGTSFDPAKHRTKADGSPATDKNGFFYSANLGRPGKTEKPGAAPAPEKPRPQSIVGGMENAPAGPVQASGDRFDAAAELYSRAFYSIADGAFNGGGEWLPENDGEHTAFRDALAVFLRQSNTIDLPPWAAFSLVAASYAGKRITKPNTSTRIRFFWNWARAKWASIRTGRKLDSLATKPIQESEKSPLPPVHP